MVVSSKAMVRGAALFLCLLVGSVTILFGCRGEGVDACAFLEATVQCDDRMVVWEQQDPTTFTLLERFRPHIFVAPGSYRPLNFYHDYLPNCQWCGTRVDDLQLGLAPDRDALQRVKKEKNVYLDNKIAAKDVLRFTEEDVQATSYGRVYEVETELGGDKRRFLFLKYSFVFPYNRFFALFATHVRGMDNYELEPVLQHQRDRLAQTLLLHEAKTTSIRVALWD